MGSSPTGPTYLSVLIRLIRSSADPRHLGVAVFPAPSINAAGHECDTGVVPLPDLLLGRPPLTRQAEAASGLDRGVTIYWRDGCPFCLRLRLAVRKYADRARWVDIWSDPDGAAYVRSVNDAGNEVVPTVVIDGIPYTNPAPSLVRNALAGR